MLFSMMMLSVCEHIRKLFNNDVFMFTCLAFKTTSYLSYDLSFAIPCLQLHE